jgi:hypothetical protein
MALQTSGQISMSNIANEKGETLSNVSLSTLSEVNLNEDPCNPVNNTASAPYGISEFYGYDHRCSTQSLYEHTIAGAYRDNFEACIDGGRSVESFIIYSDCQFLQAGCKIFMDSLGQEPFPLAGWYFYNTASVALEIREGEISLMALCEEGGDPIIKK